MEKTVNDNTMDTQHEKNVNGNRYGQTAWKKTSTAAVHVWTHSMEKRQRQHYGHTAWKKCQRQHYGHTAWKKVNGNTMDTQHGRKRQRRQVWTHSMEENVNGNSTCMDRQHGKPVNANRYGDTAWKKTSTPIGMDIQHGKTVNTNRYGHTAWKKASTPIGMDTQHGRKRQRQ